VKMQKGWLLVSLALVLLLLVSTTGVAAEEFRVGFSNASEGNTWRVAFRESVDEGIAQYDNIEYFYTNANDSVTQQIADVEDLLVQGIDLLLISPATEDALNTVVEDAYAEGVKVVVIDRRVTTDAYHSFVVAENRTLGRRSADRLVQYLYEQGGAEGEPEGKVAVIQGYAGAGPVVQRQNGIEDVLDLYPGVEIVADGYADFQRGPGLNLMEDILEAHDEIDAVISHSGESLAGAIEAIEDAGRLDEIGLFNIDGYNGILKAIDEGIVEYTNLFPAGQGELAVHVGMDLLNGKDVPRLVNMYGPDVDSDTVHRYVDHDLPDSAWTY